MRYARVRFSEFDVSSHASDHEHHESDIDNAIAFFSQDFERMLTENLEAYKAVFASRERKMKCENL